MPTLYTYVVARDYGFAPNPFFGFCTLATCKPRIRKSADIGDWVVGTGSKTKARAGYLVYAMQVSETLPLSSYWDDPRFRNKRPDLRSSFMKAFGDCIYYRDEMDSAWHQIDSHHSHRDGSPNVDNIRRDTGADRMLISSNFVYYGGDGPRIPRFDGTDIVHQWIGHRKFTDGQVISEFVRWIESLGDVGICGDPGDW